MEKETAKKIASIVLCSMNELWDVTKDCFPEINKPEVLADWDYWYGISEDWDLNIWGGFGNRLHATIYPVVNGNTDSTKGIRVSADYDTAEQRGVTVKQVQDIEKEQTKTANKERC
jgi:hypothetical protein